jgi:hypothetical protein
MPPGFQIVVNEIKGPVFATAEGRTLYIWPKRTLRNGTASGDGCHEDGDFREEDHGC